MYLIHYQVLFPPTHTVNLSPDGGSAPPSEAGVWAVKGKGGRTGMGTGLASMLKECRFMVVLSTHLNLPHNAHERVIQCLKK